VAIAAPALPAVAAGVRAEEYAARFERRMQLLQHTRQRLAGDMEQRGIGKHAVKVSARQIEFKKILLQHLAATVGARHCCKPRCTFKAGGVVSECLECLEITSRPAPEVKQLKRRWRLDVLQQRGDVLADVMIARAFPELVRVT